MNKKGSLFSVISIISILFHTACSVKTGGSADPVPTAQPDLGIRATDWEGSEIRVNGIIKSEKSLKAEKLKLIRDHFTVPNLREISVRESNGFEVYQVNGVSDLENKALIHPKLFISSSTERGSILGYSTGEKDARGRDLVTISIPVALVNGLIPALQIIGGGSRGHDVGIPLPPRYLISDPVALANRVAPKTLETLPVCPTSFSMRFRGRQYLARSPFENLSVCPVNQFFRISFQASRDEMGELLEQAAIQDDAVTITAELQVNFAVPRKVVELSISPSEFRTIIESKLSGKESQTARGKGGALYSLQDIESSISESFFDLAKRAQVNPEFSENMGHYVNSLTERFFEDSGACPSGGICRELGKRFTDRSLVRYSWTEAETVASSLRTQSVVGLGAVANSSPFLAKPSRSVVEGANRPAYFRSRTLEQTAQDCALIIPGGYEALFPGISAEERPYVESFCRNILPYITVAPGDPEQVDGYFPLGANTTVYPGAWIKIDLERIEEFTTARTREDAQGHMVIESELKDMLALDPSAKGTVCVQGENVACAKYAQHQIPVRDHQGNQVKDGNNYVFQSVMDYECDPQDLTEHCPYYRTEETIIDYKKEYDCRDTKVDQKTTFLCLGGCYEKYEMRCQEKSSEPIRANRDVPNCIGYNPLGLFPPEKLCRNPHYICENWNTNCSRYSTNENFQILHEAVAPKWRRFSIDLGEYPRRFEDQIYLKFVSPRGTVSDCRLDRFGRKFQGNTLFIKMPTEMNEDLPCGVPLWNADNVRPLYLPKVYVKNDIRYKETRLCGKTEYQVSSQNIIAQRSRTTLPPEFRASTQINIGPVPNSCRHDNPIRIGTDLLFQETPPIRISGRVSVLGRMLESIVTHESGLGGL